jgi:excisionase family DNA binding protein
MGMAEKVYQEIVTMPVVERERLFSIIARSGFEKDQYSYDEVFDDIPSAFTLKEAADYLEIAEITVRRLVKSGKIKFSKVGKNYVIGVDDLRAYKRTI